MITWMTMAIARLLVVVMPASWWRWVLGPPKFRYRGRTLPPRARGYLALQTSAGRAPAVWTVDSMRGQYDAAGPFLDGPKVDLRMVSDETWDGPTGSFRVRIYDTSTTTTQVRPGLLYLHGGGFVIGSLDSHDRWCRRLAEATDRRVVAVDYRLGPEATVDDALADVLAAWQCCTEDGRDLGLDPQRIAVAGDSAGGALALMLARARPEVPPEALGLVYPLVRMAPSTRSRQELVDYQVGLDRGLLDWFGTYMRTDDFDLLDDDLRSYPPTWLLTCGFDPLLDEGVELYEALKAADVPVRHHSSPDLFHGIITLAGVFPDDVHAALQDWAGFLRELDVGPPDRRATQETAPSSRPSIDATPPRAMPTAQSDAIEVARAYESGRSG